jgi:hypothetical protein
MFKNSSTGVQSQKKSLEQKRCNFLERPPNKIEDYWLGDISLMQFEKLDLNERKKIYHHSYICNVRSPPSRKTLQI